MSDDKKVGLTLTDEDMITSPRLSRRTLLAGVGVALDQLFRLHEAGGTIILNHLYRRHPPLASLCAAPELEFSAPFQTNIYLTPARAQGFHPPFRYP
jgi:hypothetical protein